MPEQTAVPCNLDCANRHLIARVLAVNANGNPAVSRKGRNKSKECRVDARSHCRTKRVIIETRIRSNAQRIRIIPVNRAQEIISVHQIDIQAVCRLARNNIYSVFFYRKGVATRLTTGGFTSA